MPSLHDVFQLTLFWVPCQPHVGIMFVVCKCAPYQAYPKESYIITVKHIMRYLSGTQHMCLGYPKGVYCDLVGYSDFDLSWFLLDRKSNKNTCHILGNGFVSLHNKKQLSVSLSTIEAKYVIACRCCAQIIWMKQKLSDYSVNLGVVSIRCDNTSPINLTKNQILHSHDKHI